MKVFDGHNDVLSRLWQAGGDPVAGFRGQDGHINADNCRTGEFAGGFFAIYSPAVRAPSGDIFQEDGLLEEPLPEALEPGWALRSAIGQAGIARQLADARDLALITNAATLADGFEGDAVGCLLHLEGADGIDADLLALDTLYAAGLRSVGPVWSRPNMFGHGVPFAHETTGDTGPGLTEAGHRLVQRCAELGIILDVSHITEAGFWDIAALGKPVVATHSNAWALCKSSRNLTDRQLACIRETDGMVGLIFEPAFISETGWKTGQATLEDCVAQLRYLIEHVGETRVGLGSDFDGTRTPQGIETSADLPVLVNALEDAGFGKDLIERICHGNWIAFLKRVLG